MTLTKTPLRRLKAYSRHALLLPGPPSSTEVRYPGRLAPQFNAIIAQLRKRSQKA